MRIVRHYQGVPASLRGGVLAIGNFDGVHRGHQAVIAAAGRIAAAAGVHHGVLTFEPHPRSVLQPGVEPFRLTPFRAKARHVATLGVAVLFTIRFDRRFAQLSAEAFVEAVLAHGIAPRHVVIGYDFVFGHQRKGTPKLLESLGSTHGFGVTILDPIQRPGGEVFSSTRIRQHLGEGRPRPAAALLGRAWEVEGRVLRGEARGRRIGFPTANLALGPYLRPAIGVYAVRAGVAAGSTVTWFDGVANCGRRPTFGGEEVRLEVNLFDYSGDLYGRHLRVALIDYLRPEKRFEGLESLQAQIRQDAQQAREILSAERTAAG